jgi:hypothetical protein
MFITLREDKPWVLSHMYQKRPLIEMSVREIVSRVRSMFLGRSRATWIQLDPLTYSSVASLVSRTLRRSKDNVAPLSRLIHSISAGNAFSVRNLLTTLQRQHLVSSERAAMMALAELSGRSPLIGMSIVGSQFQPLLFKLALNELNIITDTISRKLRRYSYPRNLL